MEKIKLGDIDFSKLKKCSIQGTTSTMYKSDDKCIKILDKFTEEEKNNLYLKLLDMNGIKIDNLMMPIELIIQNGKLEGYTTENFKNSINIYDKFINPRYVNVKEILNALKKASLILREIHENGIIVQDLSFDNILIDNTGNVKFIDIDACNYNEHVTNIIPLLLKRYMIDYRNDCVIISKNTDRLSMLLATFSLLYLMEVQRITKRKYMTLASNINTVENLHDTYITLSSKKKKIGELEYLDEFIDENDDFIIDREKQYNVIEKVLVYFYK